MSYSIPYLTVVIILFCLYLVETRKLKAGSLSINGARWIAYVLMWAFVGLRGHIMSDFISYYPYYERYPDIFHLSSADFLNGFEVGFNIYTSIIKTFTDNYFVWVAVNTLIDIMVLAWFFHRYCRSMILPLIFFMAFNGLLMEFNLYRNMKAIDLFLLSVPYLLSRKWLPYFALNILGLTFHTSSALYLPLYFLLTLRMPKYVLWGGFIFANIIFIANVSVIGSIINNLSFIQNLQAYDKLTGYANEGSEYKISIGYLERTISFLIFALLYKKMAKEDKSNVFFFNCYWIYYVSFLVFYEVSVFVDRIPTLFIFSYWVLYPHAVSLKYRYGQFVRLFIALLIPMKIISAFNYDGASYENILFDKPDFYKRKAIIEIDFLDAS